MMSKTGSGALGGKDLRAAWGAPTEGGDYEQTYREGMCDEEMGEGKNLFAT